MLGIAASRPHGDADSRSYNRPQAMPNMSDPSSPPSLQSTQAAPGGVMRLIDANANRCREALRVAEDYARFVLDSRELSSRIKTTRHQLADATRTFLPDALLYRDTPGDVGTTTKTEAEGVRQNLADVLTAATKRAGEAMRALSEYLKTLSPAAAEMMETLRYDWYDIERQLLITLRPGLFPEVRLYVLVTESLCRRPWREVAEAALAGGADCLQLREKDLDSGELLRRAKHLVSICRKHGARCIINDRADIALLSDADGVHVGQGDLSAIDARKIVGTRKIVGVSTHCLDQARQALLDGADYIGVGPFFRSATKPRDFIAGPAFAFEVASQIRLPAVAIAGITLENVDEVLATGVKAIAVSSAVISSDDVTAAARALKQRIVSSAVCSA